MGYRNGWNIGLKCVNLSKYLWSTISQNFHEKATKVNINKVVSPANLPKQTCDQKTVFIIYFKTFADIIKILD